MSTVVIYAYLRDANGNAKSGSYGYAELIDTPYYYDGVYFSNPTERGIRSTSDANGLIEWTVPQGARVRFRIDDIDLVLEKAVPISGTSTDLYDLEDL